MNILEDPYLHPLTREIAEEAYNEPHRVYHGLNHINRMWKHWIDNKGFADRLDEPVPNHVALLFIIFHDIVYNLQKDFDESNEIKSDLQFLNHSVLYDLTPKEVYLISQAIRATEFHFLNYKSLPEQVQILMDLDLYDLSTDTETFLRLNEAVIQEFSFEYGRDASIEGRTQWLRKSLQQPHIYRILTERDDYAKANLAIALGELT